MISANYLMIDLEQGLEKIIKDTAEVARILWELGWAESSAGNISVNVTEHIPEDIKELNKAPSGEIDKSYPELSGFSFFITGAGTRMRDLAKVAAENACILRLAEQSNRYHVLWGKRSGIRFEPTSELHAHLSIHRFLHEKKAPQKVIIHAHPEELIALTHVKEYKQENILNRLLWSMNPETKIIIQKGVGLVPYHVPGSDELAQATIKALEKHDVVLWEKHGCLAIGVDVVETFDQVDILNKAARIFFICKNAGLRPEGLSDAQLNELERLFWTKK
jgi:rhamnulose-1-phosphate aldolase